MKCLSPGTLQAYLDSELPEIEMRDISAHVEACVVCRGRLADLEATAQRVHAWLDALPSRDLVVPVETVTRILPIAGPTRWRWIAVAAGLVLAVSAAFFPANNHRKAAVPTKVALARTSVRSAAVRDPEPQPDAPHRVVRVRKRLPSPVRHAQPAGNDFIALGDPDPMQIGVVVRVKVPIADTWLPGQTQEVAADLVIGEDGRARAIRFVR